MNENNLWPGGDFDACLFNCGCWRWRGEELLHALPDPVIVFSDGILGATEQLPHFAKGKAVENPEFEYLALSCMKLAQRRGKPRRYSWTLPDGSGLAAR